MIVKLTRIAGVQLTGNTSLAYCKSHFPSLNFRNDVLNALQTLPRCSQQSVLDKTTC